MSLHPDDDLARIYRQAAHEEPAAWLDERICSEAAHAASSPDHVLHRGPRWFPYVALAATVVLTTSTVLMMRTDPPNEAERVNPLDEPIAAVQPRAPADVQPPASPSGPAISARSADKAATRTPNRAKSEADMPAAAPSLNALSASKGAAPAATGADEALIQPPRESSPKALEQERGEPPPPAVAPSNARDETTKATRARQDAVARSAEGNPLAVEEDPVEWLRHIESLRRQGRENEVRAAITAFRKKYPDYRIPPGLE